MPTVCDILRKHEGRFASIEAKLAGIGLWDNMGDAKLIGSQWEVGGDMIAVWTAATTRPLAWSQGQWVKLSAGKIEARGESFVFKSSDTGARIELDGTEFAGYDSGGTKQFYLRATDGKAYFAGGNAIMSVDGIVLSDELIVKRETAETADQTDRGMYLSVLANPAAPSSTTFLGLRVRSDSVEGCAQNIANLTGMTLAARHYGTGEVTNMEGGYGVAGLYTSGGNTPFACGWSGSLYVNTGTTITKGYNLWARTQGGNAGTITDAYGLFVDAVYGTNKYGIYQDGADDLNVFKGDLELKTHLFDHTGLADNKMWRYQAASSNWVLVDAAAPGFHAAEHEDGGGDEIDLTGMSGEEIRLVPKAASAGAEGTIFYCSTDDYVYVATE